MAQMDISKIGIVLVVDSDQRLLGTITDGDVRRAVLAKVDIEEPVETLLTAKEGSRFAQATTGPAGADRSTLLGLLQQHNIRHLPLVDDDQRVAGLATLDEYVTDLGPPAQAVIMAGGRGSRLHPLTERVPKPMLPVGDRPLMEFIVQQLRSAGINRISVSVHHKSETIIEHFGDGREFGVEISYVTEERSLGTAGALGLMESPQETMLVINGDILTQVDIRAMMQFHREHRSYLTVAVQHRNLQFQYGVIECEGTSVRRITEKPSLSFLVNAGIYLLEPPVYRFIPNDERYDMTDLIQRLLDENYTVVAFPVHEYWLDIGEKADYEQAQEHVKSWKLYS